MSFDATRAVWKRLDDEDCGLSSPARIVLLLLADHADVKTGIAWPGRSTICQRTGLGRSTVGRAITELCDNGYIRIVVAGGGAPLATNRYHLTVSTADPVRSGPCPIMTATVSTPGRDRVHSGHRISKEPMKNQA